MAGFLGTGTTVAFGSEFTATPADTVYEITNVDWGGITRSEVEATHMGTVSPEAGKEFGGAVWIPGSKVDLGEVTIEGHWNPDMTPPIADAVTTLTVDWGGLGANNTWAASGICNNFDFNDAFEDKMGFSCTVRMTGGLTIA